MDQVKPALHFVSFRGDEFTAAVRLFGYPDFIHRRWDLRAHKEIHESDVVVFAHGDFDKEPATQSGNDIDEEWL